MNGLVIGTSVIVAAQAPLLVLFVSAPPSLERLPSSSPRRGATPLLDLLDLNRAGGGHRFLICQLDATIRCFMPRPS